MLKRIGQKLKDMYDDDSGAMSVEKIMIIALISLPIVLALFFFRRTLIQWFEGKSDQLQDDSIKP